MPVPRILDAAFRRLGLGGGRPVVQAVGGSTPAAPQGWFGGWATGNPGGDAEPVVNEHTALSYLALYACVGLIASTIASLPLATVRRAGRSWVDADDLDEFWLLDREFNPDMSAMDAREASTAHVLTWGNGYAQVGWNKSGSTFTRIDPITPDLVRPVRDGRGRLGYEVYRRGTAEVAEVLPAREVLHVRGLGFDGLVGYSPVRVARTALRSGVAQDREAERFVTRGIRAPGAVKFPAGKKFANQQQAVEWRDRFRAIHSTEDGSLNVAVLEDGADWVSLGVDPESAQLLESRKFSRGEIAGMYRVPPHMIGDTEKTTSWGTGIDDQQVGFVVYTLRQWLVRTEQEYDRKLFGGRRDLRCTHRLDALLRGDALKRAQSLEIQHRRGVVTDNEWRTIENRNPVAGGDVRHFPLNEGRVDDDGDDVPPPAGVVPAAEPPADPATGGADDV